MNVTLVSNTFKEELLSCSKKLLLLYQLIQYIARTNKLNECWCTPPTSGNRPQETEKKSVFKLWVVFIITILIWGAYTSQYEYITAENGLGYWLVS